MPTKKKPVRTKTVVKEGLSRVKLWGIISGCVVVISALIGTIYHAQCEKDSSQDVAIEAESSAREAAIERVEDQKVDNRTMQMMIKSNEKIQTILHDSLKEMQKTQTEIIKQLPKK